LFLIPITFLFLLTWILIIIKNKILSGCMKKYTTLFFQISCLLLLAIIGILFYQQQVLKKQNGSKIELAAKEQLNETLTVIQNRKSVRSFISGKPVGDEDLLKIIRAGMAAPSGRDIRPWEILVVTDRLRLDSMAAGLPYTKMLMQAPAAIVVCGDTTKSFYWYLDCSAVTQNILLAAESLGLGAVWTAAYPYEERMDIVAKYTGLPSHIKPLAVIPLGYPDGEFQPKDKYDSSKIHYDKW
jgi:nitroreductase